MIIHTRQTLMTFDSRFYARPQYVSIHHNPLITSVRQSASTQTCTRETHSARASPLSITRVRRHTAPQRCVSHLSSFGQVIRSRPVATAHIVCPSKACTHIHTPTHLCHHRHQHTSTRTHACIRVGRPEQKFECPSNYPLISTSN